MLELSIFSPFDLKVTDDQQDTIIFLSPDEITQIADFVQEHTCPAPGCKNLVKESDRTCEACRAELTEQRREAVYDRRPAWTPRRNF